LVKMQDRICPNFWENCEDCKHDFDCRAGLYHGENILIKAAEISERVTHEEAIKSVKTLKGNKVTLKGDMVAGFMSLTTDEFMNWFYGWRVQSLHHKEPIPLDGPSAPGGGSKSKKHQKPQRKVPEYMKMLGM